MTQVYPRATIYFIGGIGWGYKRLEAKDVQYSGGNSLLFILKGKRALREFPDQPSFVILNGWDTCPATRGQQVSC
jgi:hypothetical protein